MTTLPRGREFTRADLDAMPDDGNRYELVDGAIIVTPSPTWRHQGMSMELSHALRLACPDDLRVVTAPFDVPLGDRTVVQPDIIVTRAEQRTDHGHVGNPLLAVEILSPSTRHIDLGLKRSRLEAAGVPSYWAVDPAEPSIVVWELADGAYVEVVRAVGDEPLTIERPYPVTLVPQALVR